MLIAVALLSTAASCNGEVGGPSPCTEDSQCAPVCEAACGIDPLISASCDDFLRACVCECEVTGEDAGPGADAGADAER